MDFNLKNLEPNDPISLYNKLERLVRFGDKHATVKGQKDEIQGYFLGGLLVNDIKRSSVSSEAINTLYAALKSHEVSHAVLPDDVHKGQIPLILDDHTRSYLRNHLQELIEYENLSWRIFFIPIKIDFEDDELMHAEIMFEADLEDDDNIEYLSLHYSRIENYLNELSAEDVATVDTSFIKVTDGGSDSDAGQPSMDNKPIKSYDETSLDEYEFDDKELNANDKDETENQSIINEEVEARNEDVNEIEKEDEEDNIVEVLDSDVSNEFTEIPQELQSTLDDFYIGRFNEFDNLQEKDTTHVILQKEIRNANNLLEMREKDFKRKAKQLYMQYMSQSYDAINRAIDVETGDDIVKNKHQEIENKKLELDLNVQKRIEKQKNDLEHRFWNEHFETFKEQTLAGLKLRFEKEEYYNLVSEPLERYEEIEKNRNEDEKLELTHKQSNWLDNIKTDAIIKDRNNAIIEVQNYLEGAMRSVQIEIKEIDTKMTDLNERFIQYEYSKKAEERLRETVGSDLYTDEQAKKYKKQYEITEQEKSNAINEIEELKEKYEKDMKTKVDEYNSFKQEIETSHQNVLKSKDDKLTILNDKLKRVQNENEENKAKLDTSDRRKRKQLFGTGIGAFLVSTVIFGGTALGVYNKNEGVHKELEEKNKIVNQQKEEARKNSDELEKIKKEKEEERKKQQQVIDEQKKALDKHNNKK